MRDDELRIFWQKFNGHRAVAHARGIPFLLTFEEWCSLWEESGHWCERGRGRGKYEMARVGDRGPYAVGNIRIVTREQNRAEFQRSRRDPAYRHDRRLRHDRIQAGIEIEGDTLRQTKRPRR
jgi:hypothetical protein